MKKIKVSKEIEIPDLKIDPKLSKFFYESSDGEIYYDIVELIEFADNYYLIYSPPRDKHEDGVIIFAYKDADRFIDDENWVNVKAKYISK